MLRNKVLVIIAIVCALGVSALAAYVKFVPHGVTPNETTPPSRKPIVVPPPTDPPKNVANTVTVYTPHMGATGMTFEAAPSEVPAGADAKVFAVNEFLKAAQITPEKAVLLSIQVEDGVAHVGFSREFDRTYGTFEEKSLLDGFAAALGQFPDVNSYVLEVDGKPLATLGSVSLSEPVPVIRPADVPRPGSTIDPPVNTDQPTPSTPSDTPTTMMPGQPSADHPLPGEAAKGTSRLGALSPKGSPAGPQDGSASTKP